MGYTAVVDYGVGNLKSVTNAMNYLGLRTCITSEAKELECADAIILPGVGAFPDAAEKLRATGLEQTLMAQAERKPILGICLGMQMLFDRGEEVRECKGLGLVPGCVRKIETNLKLPHIGWNSLTYPNPSPLFTGVEEGSYVYFVHSFCGVAADPATARPPLSPRPTTVSRWWRRCRRATCTAASSTRRRAARWACRS